MKLTKTALLALRGVGTEAKQRIADAGGGVTISTVNRWIADNDDNLTKAAIMKVIASETGIAETDLLEVENKSSVPA